jgi:pimeloyl-ACP methyl ester carboxylesterase
MAMIASNGAKLYVEETGTGYPIVFVHEFGADHREWEAQVRYFSRQYRCISFNARGYPPSDVPNSVEAYGWEHSRDDIAAVMRGLAIEKAHIVGLSMGAYATLQFGIRYPEMCSALVVAGVGTGSPPEIHKEWRKQSEASGREFLEKGMAAVAESMAHSPTRIQLFKKDPRAWREFLNHLSEHSAQGMSLTVSRYQALRPSLHEAGPALSALTVPVLLAVGDEDEPCVQTNLFLKQKIRSAGLWVCPNTGHAINLEEPAAFNAAVLEFFGLAERGKWPCR